jgi:lysine 6-dehydrogenase
MRFLVLGGGAQGSAAAYDLLRAPDVESVLVVDQMRETGAAYLRPLRDDRLRFATVDASDFERVRWVMRDRDVVLCALPYPFNFEMARLSIEAGAHFSDLGGNAAVVERQRLLGPEAIGAGVTVIPDCGLAPGIVNIVAEGGIQSLDETDSVRMWVGGLPQRPVPPLNYRLVYSIEGLLDYYTTPGVVLRDGEVERVEALSGLERMSFAGPVGELEAFITAGGTSALPERYRGRIRCLEYRTLRFPGHAAIMKALRDLGFFGTEPIMVGGKEVPPRQLFIRLAGERLREGDERDLVVLRVEVRGRRGGAPIARRWDLFDTFDEGLAMTAMSRCTGFALAIVGLMQGRGEIETPGVRTAHEAVPSGPFIRALAERGIRLKESDPGPEPGGVDSGAGDPGDRAPWPDVG